MLGGSTQQVPAITKAKEMGYYTVLIDFLPDNPGQFVADKWYQESTTDVEAVYRIAKEEGVSGILPYASDPAALPAAIVAQRLGLPSNPVEAVEILGIKHKFRRFLQQNGFTSPQTYIFSPDTSLDEVSANLNKLRFPIVIKPTDSSGSKGVSFIQDASNLTQAISAADRYSRNKILIAEEFIHRGYPNVIGGDIFVENGKIILFGDMECLRGDNGAGLIPIGKKKPNGLNTNQSYRLHEALQKLIDKLGIQFGELNIEVLIDENDNPVFLEVGPRAGGNMIPIELSDIFGIDLIKANISAAMGQPTGLTPDEPQECYMTYVLHSLKDGIFERVNYSPQIQPYIYRTVHYKQPGDPVEYFDGAGKALGIVFMKFPDESVMHSFELEIDRHIKVILK